MGQLIITNAVAKCKFNVQGYKIHNNKCSCEPLPVEKNKVKMGKMQQDDRLQYGEPESAASENKRSRKLTGDAFQVPIHLRFSLENPSRQSCPSLACFPRPFTRR